MDKAEIDVIDALLVNKRFKIENLEINLQTSYKCYTDNLRASSTFNRS
jgi:hypothetical protein